MKTSEKLKSIEDYIYEEVDASVYAKFRGAIQEIEVLESLTEEDFQEISGWFDNYINFVIIDIEGAEGTELRERAVATAGKLHNIRNLHNESR